MFRRLSILQKLIVANLLYSIPVISLIYLMVSSQNVNIDFAKKELQGNVIQRPMVALLGSLLKFRMDFAIGQNKETIEDINKNWETLGPVWDSLTEDLQLSEDSLKQRHRDSAFYPTALKRWQAFVELMKAKSKSHDDLLAELTGIIADVRTMITHIGDTSNLILDPDLDSYYLMDATLVAYPINQDRVSDIFSYVAHRKDQLAQIHMDEKIQMAIYANSLRQVDLDRIQGDFDTTINEDKNFYGLNNNVQANLKNIGVKLRASEEIFAKQLDAIVSGENIPEFSKIQKAAYQSLDDSISTWVESQSILDELLTTRVNSLTAEKYKDLIMALAALALSVLILYLVSLSFTLNMGSVIQKLQGSVDATRQSSEDMVNVSTELSGLSDNQASAIQETSAAVEEITLMVKSTMSNTETTTHSTDVTYGKAQTSVEILNSLMAAINDISQSNELILSQIEHSSKGITDITKIISEISTKTKIIDEIVFQTKLLAFNASVESARAGKAGKGFGVVAEEVGKLAEMSGNAAKDINTMLGDSIHKANSLSEETNLKVGSLVSSAKQKLQKGIEQAQLSKKTVEDILNLIKEVKENSENIQAAATEQSTGLTQVSKAIHLLDASAESNLTVSKKTADQSFALANQAEGLESVVLEIKRVVFGSKD